MAILHHNHHHQLDSLYCLEEPFEEAVLEEEENNNNETNPSHNSSLLHQDLFWEDEELLSLFTKQQQQQPPQIYLKPDSPLSLARTESVKWILKVNTHYGFSPITAILSITYLDKFISTLHFQKDKPWMVHLAAVTCLSLAAKFEETQVPLLLDLQVEDTQYVFEPKTIQKMELLILSTLEWKMNLVTPISFLHHIIRRLGLKTHLHWEFLKRCELLILSLVADLRFVHYLPAVLATATMMQVINEIELCNPIDYQTQLLDVLNINKETVNECYELITEESNAPFNKQKRKYQSTDGNPNPNEVIDSRFSFVGSSPQEPLLKKSRAAQERYL